MEPLPESKPTLTPEQGHALLVLARGTLKAHFKPTAVPAHAPPRAEGALQARCGTFVTLKLKKQLRGCIGSLSSSSPIVDGVRENALNAAFHDPRFPPLGEEELPEVVIEVSVLTRPEPLAYTDAEDLMSKLQPHMDGVILRKGGRSATFLPQVWEQLPRPDTFLSHLCMKAGLSPDRWRQADVSIQVYQVQSFEEKE